MMFEYLHTFDLSDWNSRPIETAMRRDLKMNSLPFSIQFIIDLARGNIQQLQWNQPELRIHTESLYNIFKAWEASADVKIKTTQMAFSKSINEIQKSERIEITVKII
jgi:hypothetical protein